MPGCARISVSLHMITQTAVFIDTFKDLRSDLHWCYCNIFTTQDHIVAFITHYLSDAVFSWKIESLKEYWYFIVNALIYLEDDVKGHRLDLIVDDGGYMTLLIHEGRKADYFFLNYGTIHDPSSTENVEFNIVQTIIKR